MTPAEAREAIDFEQSRVGFHEWLVFDSPLHGAGPSSTFLARCGRRPPVGERRYLERMRLSHLRPYEVQAVRRDEGLDSWTCGRTSACECASAWHRQFVQWDILAARVILAPRATRSSTARRNFTRRAGRS